MRISKIYNANVYIDGTNSLLGRAKEITLPDIAPAMEEHGGLGMVGKISLPTGLGLLETKIKWAGWYADHLTTGANPFVAHKLQVRASLESYEAGGRVDEQPLIVQLTSRWKKVPLGTLAQQANPELEDELATSYVRVVLGGKELVEIDVLANIWRVDGKDVLEAYNKALGG